MKRSTILITAAAALFYLLPPVFAQHGRGGGMGGGMGAGNGMGHGDMGSSHGPSSNSGSNSSGSEHGKSVNDLLSQNQKLAGKIQSLTGMDAKDACSGFKNLGQCVAAAHVSKNLGMTFACLKADMTGQAPASSANCPAGAGSKSMSLGKAIQTLDPQANAKAEAKKGSDQAASDMKSSGS